jgi:hypothetical protein
MKSKKITAGVLNTILIVSLLIAALTSSIVFVAYYKKLILIKLNNDEKALLNAESGINYLLASPELDEEKQYTIQIHEADNDTISLLKKPWGIFDIAISVSSKNTSTSGSALKVALVGVKPDIPGSLALYLADHKNHLTLSSSSNIIGNVSIPKSGWRFDNSQKVTIKEKIIDGVVESSVEKLPEVNEKYRRRTVDFCSIKLNYEQVQRLDEIPSNYYSNSFSETTQLIYNDNAIRLTNSSLKGNVIIASTKEVIVERTNELEDIIIVAPKIIFKEGFEGSLQAFASEAIIVEKGSHLIYPSALIVNSESVLIGGNIDLQEGCSVSGLIYMGRQTTQSEVPSLFIDKGVELSGSMFVEGSVEHKGIIHGNLVCDKFLLRKNSMTYENYIDGGSINSKSISPFFMTSSLLSKSSNFQIIKWLY